VRTGAGDTQFLPIETSLLRKRDVSCGTDLVGSVITDIPAQAGATGDEIFHLAVRAFDLF
jgi:hypothetical protein